MEAVTTVTLEGAQSFSAFSIQASSEGSEGGSVSPQSESPSESGETVWLSEPLSPAVMQISQDHTLDQQEGGAGDDLHGSNDAIFVPGISDNQHCVAAVVVDSQEFDPVATSSGCITELGEVCTHSCSLDELGDVQASSDTLVVQSHDPTINAPKAGSGIQGPAASIAGSSEGPASDLNQTCALEESGHAFNPHCPQLELDHVVDPLDCPEEHGRFFPPLGYPEPPVPTPPVSSDLSSLSTPLSGSSGTAGPTGGLWELPRIVRHKPSSIAFSDYCPESTAGRGLYIGESSDGGEESSSEDDDVFEELPQRRGILTGRRRRGRPRRNGPGVGAGQDGPNTNTLSRQDTTGSSSCDAEEEAGSTEESPQALSPWSESMTQLMKKLDQLNLDIEEALSSGSSPSHTPSIARKQPPDASSGTAVSQAPNKNSALRNPEREGCGDQDSSSSSNRTAAGVPAGPKQMEVAAKMSNERAGKLILHCFYKRALLPCDYP
ncbi:hypothetical protein MATL_G00122180 [Megalops atlanticus]|uniref:Uncharacterized protein n=1 Tax=Megalops atlanticus TaxID=7932 RepID=A0A9D3PXX4_MEGAT|nr:hypothetical protein MATL_G00122180 [Megalops atlanticus]